MASQPEPRTPAWASPVGRLAGLVGCLVLTGVLMSRPERPRAEPPVVRQTNPMPPPAVGPAVPTPEPTPAPVAVAEIEAPPAPEPPKLDAVAVTAAEDRLDAASRDRARAEARAQLEARALADAAAQAAASAKRSRTLGARVRDPSARIATASSRGGFLKADRDRLKEEVVALSRAPRPRAKVLSNKNPVARPTEGNEYHFEIRGDRVTFIDLERLLLMVKNDARLRIRLSDGARVVDSRVGPVGAFSLHYSLMRSIPGGLEELMERRGVSYQLRAWEVVPEFEGRGETFDATRGPISEFARVLNRLNVAKDSITLWTYPDGFDLFRKLRDDLRARGFTVAARPLPQGMAVRGSPAGSLSAGQ